MLDVIKWGKNGVEMCCVMLLLYDRDKGVNKAILEGFDVDDVGVYGWGGERVKERCLMRWMMGVVICVLVFGWCMLLYVFIMLWCGGCSDVENDVEDDGEMKRQKAKRKNV